MNGAILVQTILAFSAMITPLRCAFESVSIEYEEVSRVMGHGMLSTFINVVLPMAKKGVVSSILMGFAKAFSDFGATIMVAGMIIGKTATLPAAIYVEMGAGNTEAALAMIFLLMVISLIINIVTRLLR